MFSSIQPRRSLSPWTWLGLSLLALTACKLEQKPDSGGLAIIVDSDMAISKDIDQLRITATQGGQSLLDLDQQLVSPLPREFRLPRLGNPAAVTIRAIALKQGIARVERSAIVSVPDSYVGVVRLSLNFLCDGTATMSDESTCGTDQTCNQGSCEPAVLGALADYAQQTAIYTSAQSTDSTGDAGAPTCFNIMDCLSEATEVTPDPVNCTFPLPQMFNDRLNVALRLDPGSAGFCDSKACWIVLNSGADGFRVVGSEVQLPVGVCSKRNAGVNIRVAVSPSCPAKLAPMPLCSVTKPSEPAADNPLGNPTVEFQVPIGDACVGPSKRTCGNCGTSTRTCANGLWADWSPCSGEGVCAIDAVQSCGKGGTSTCDRTCKWGECENEPCAGAPTETCGNCGTRRRVCMPGAVWGPWSACEHEGVCKPDSVQACAGGTQVCSGSCQWGACGNSGPCDGAPMMSCGNCGTHSRTCNATTDQWSEWGACEAEGECAKDATRACGDGQGVQTCGGDCKWDAACAGQCVGMSMRSCTANTLSLYRCGTQSRTCDTTTSTWSDWSACQEGACSPYEVRRCGVNLTGTQLCSLDCQWETECDGQVCTGSDTQRCGANSCGTQTRNCDHSTGAWSNWGACVVPSDACVPGRIIACSTSRGPGTQICGLDCQWTGCIVVPTGGSGGAGSGGAGRGGSGGTGPKECTTPKPPTACGNCGTQDYVCNTTTGLWDKVGSCVGQGSCKPGASVVCPNGGTGTCNATCELDETTCQKPCDPATRPSSTCGNCGTQAYMCNTNDGTWEKSGSCVGQGVCQPGELVGGCPGEEMGTCSSTCQLDQNTCPKSCDPTKKPDPACGNCGMQAYTCNMSTGGWITSGECMGQGSCKPGSTVGGCPGGGSTICGASCEPDLSACPKTCDPATKPSTNCGNCGTQAYTCNSTSGAWQKMGECTGEGSCKPGTTVAGCPGGGTGTCGPSCELDESTCAKSCDPAAKPSETCGMCGTQAYTCNSSTGTWDKLGGCTGQGSCAPNTTVECPGGGTTTCNASCEPNLAACPKTCAPATKAPTACGMCGTQAWQCVDGDWVVSGSCIGEHGECVPNDTQSCPGSDTKLTCNAATCTWIGACPPPEQME